MKKTNRHYRQFVSLSNVYQNLPRLLLVTGWLFIIVGVLGIGALQQLVSTPQDSRSQAVNPEGQVTIRFVANPSSAVSGQNIVFTGYINTRSVLTDGVQLVLVVPKASFSSPPIMALTEKTDGQTEITGLQIGLNKVIEKGDIYELQFIALPATIGQPFTTKNEIPFVTIEGTANIDGSYRLSADLSRCLVTRFGSDPVIDELAPIMSVDFTVTSSNLPPPTTPTPTDQLPPPTNTPTPTDPVPSPSYTPTPTDSVPSPTLTITPTPSPTPISSPTPTPTFGSDGDNNNLSLSFRLQKLTTTDQDLNAVLYLQNSVSVLEKENGDIGEATSEKMYEYPANFRTSLGGKLSNIEPILLTDLPISTQGNAYDVFVKTPVSLRKKLGTMTLRQGSNLAPVAWSETQLMTGDFLQSPQNEWNVINLLDVAKILSIYTQLQVPVTEINQIFDVNFDQIIDIMDVAIVLSNYTQLEVRGD